MGQIHNGLQRPLVLFRTYFIHQKRQNNRKRKSPQQPQNTGNNGILQHSEEIGRLKQRFKVLQPHPFRTPDSLYQRKILKRNLQSVHGP